MTRKEAQRCVEAAINEQDFIVSVAAEQGYAYDPENGVKIPFSERLASGVRRHLPVLIQNVTIATGITLPLPSLYLDRRRIAFGLDWAQVNRYRGAVG